MKYFNLNEKQKFFSLLCLGALAVGLPYWYFTRLENGETEREVTKVDQTIKILSTTKVRQTVYYEKCREEETQESTVKAGEAGLNYTQFQALYPGWNIEIFNPEQIKMSLLDSGCCKEHQKHKFIGIQGDYVAVFYGKPEDGKPILKELTQIKVKAVNAQALDEVKKGIIFQSNEEMLRILEGLHSK